MTRFMSIVVLTAVAAIALTARAQESVGAMTVPSALQQVYAGMYHFVEPETGDTLAMLVFNPITIFPAEKFKNKKEEEGSSSDPGEK